MSANNQQCPKQSTCQTDRALAWRGPFSVSRTDGMGVALLYMAVGAAVGFIAGLWLAGGGL